MTTPNFRPGIGRLATDRYDFQSHLDGENPPGFTDFRHTADQIDMVTPVIGGATNVQNSLANVAAFIASQSGAGQGFVTVGDGYDTWHAADGTTNFDPNIPSLDILLNPVFDAITNNTAVPAGFERIERGGIIIIKAGTYIVNKTINVPPGIFIVGEGYGTKIINATNLTLSPLPPVPKTPVSISAATNASPIQITTSTPVIGLVTGDIININGVGGNTIANNTWVVTVIDSLNFTLNGSTGNASYTSGGSVITIKPIFKILPDANRSVNDAAVDPNLFIFSRETKIMNMVIADNFVENTILGDVFYKLPQNKTSSSILNPPALVWQESGSNFHLSGVYFVGRANFSSGQIVSNVTGSAIFLDTTIPSSTGTILKVNDCFLDGFSEPIIFNSTAGSNDYLEVSRCKIRGYGYYNGDSSSASKNCIINANVCNIEISDNYLYGNSDNMLTTVYANSLPTGGAPISQNKSRILISENNLAVNKLSGSSIETGFLALNTAISAANMFTYASTILQSNNINFDGYSAYRLYLDNSTTPQLFAEPTRVIIQPSGTNSSVVINPTGTGSTVTMQSAGVVTIASTGSGVSISGGGGASTLFANAFAATLNSPSTTVSGNIVQVTSGSGDVFVSTSVNGSVFITPVGTGTTQFFNAIKGINYPLNFSLASVALSSTTPVTLSNTQYNTQTLKFTGSLSNDINVVFPNIAGYSKLIDNSTTGNFNILLGVSGQATPIAMYPGEKFWIYADGTNIVKGCAVNRILNVSKYINTGTYGSTINSTVSSSFVDTLLTVSINGARTGDYLLINGLLSGSTTGVAEAIITIVDGSTTDLAESTVRFGSVTTELAPVAVTRSLTGTNSFTVTAKVRLRAISGTSFITAPASLVVQLLRP